MQNMKKTIIRSSLSTLALVAALSVGASYASAAAGSSTPVKTVQAQKVTLRRSTTQPASVHAYYEAELHSKVSGYLKSVAADIGDVVKGGQTLAVIDVPEMMKGYESQQAEVERTESARKQFRAAIDVARAKVDQAEAEIGKAKAQSNASTLEYKRIEELVRTKAVTQKLADETLSRKLASEAELASVKASQAVAVANLRASEADADGADASAVVTRKRLEEMEVLMQYATLKAPFAGVVTERNVDPGDFVRNAQTISNPGKPLFSVARMDKMRVRVPIPERDAVYVKKGDKVEFVCRALGNKPIQAKVSRTSRRLDSKTRTMLVEIDLPNEDGRLLPGMYGTISIMIDEKLNAVVVPSNAVRYGLAGESVIYVLRGGDKIAHAPVKVGHDDGHNIEILSGLNGTEQIVTGMLGRLKDGASVTVVKN